MLHYSKNNFISLILICNVFIVLTSVLNFLFTYKLLIGNIDNKIISIKNTDNYTVGLETINLNNVTVQKQNLNLSDDISSKKYTNILINASIYKIRSIHLMNVPKLDFLKGLKNPCFFVKTPPDNDGGVRVSSDVVLKCWPYYQLVGVEKCGTTDLYVRLHSHHQLLQKTDQQQKPVKESLWYNGIYSNSVHQNTVGGYLALMDNATHTINQRCPGIVDGTTENKEQMCPYIVGDFSARTMNHNYLWHGEAVHTNLTVPHVLVADKVYHINPETKIIIMLRNPTTRLYSDYNFYSRFKPKHDLKTERPSPTDFHNRVVTAIDDWEMCVSQLRLHEDTCANGYHWASHRGIKTGHFWEHGSSDRLRVGIYSIYVNDWLRVFPRKNILFIKMEDYSVHPLQYMEKYVLPFLELEPFKEEAIQYLLSLQEKKVQMNRFHMHVVEDMWEKTREILDNFYLPYNRELTVMLNDDRFLWSELNDKLQDLFNK